MNLRDSTFVPGGIAFQSKLPLDSPYLFVIILSSVLLVLLLILFIRELCKVFPCENSTESCCSCKCDRTRYSSFDDCCGSCAQALDCCERTSLDSCLDSCCPKRGVSFLRLFDQFILSFINVFFSHLTQPIF